MQASHDTSTTPLFDPRQELFTDPVSNEGVPSDPHAEESFRERRLIRLWYFPDSFVD